jgi:hypothetical protein
MRTALLGIATAVLVGSPVLAADFVAPYTEGYIEPAPEVVVVRPAPVVTEVVPAPVVVRRRVVVVRPPLPVYDAPRAYAYSYPVRRFGPWGYHHRPHYGW